MKQNSILVIHPYRYFGGWVFDDAATGLVREAFVSGADKIIDSLVEAISNADKGFLLRFSAQPFPGHTHVLLWDRQESGGNWYRCNELDLEGWLCPSLFRYFDTAPDNIYVQCLKGGES